MSNNVKINSDFEVDLVYLWVNGSDPQWIARRNRSIGRSEDGSAINCDGRFADNDELKYSLRAVEKYAPWIRKIFIVTDNQIPCWLDTSHPKIKIIDHSEILPPEALPTFNSVVIEHALHRIPDLAEHFLYANDDTFFNRPVTRYDFFTPEGLPIARLNRRPFRRLSLWLEVAVQGKTLSNYNLTIQNAAELVRQKFGKYVGHKTHHNIDAYRKSDYAHAFELFKDDILPTLSNRVRSENDIQRNLYTYVSMIERKCKVSFVSRSTSFRLHIEKRSHYTKLNRLSPMLFCINDSQFASDEDRQFAKEFLMRRFPDKSSFEVV